jgi:hypothetical protein
MEGLKESDAIDKDMLLGDSNNQERIFNTKQLILVGNRQFEFTQFDNIFSLSRSPFLDELNLSTSSVDINNLKKKLLTLAPNQLPSCFCCGKEIGSSGSKKTKIDGCHFCQKWGCDDCIEKSFPFPLRDDASGEILFGKICKVCETKFYIK